MEIWKWYDRHLMHTLATVSTLYNIYIGNINLAFFFISSVYGMTILSELTFSQALFKGEPGAFDKDTQNKYQRDDTSKLVVIIATWIYWETMTCRDRMYMEPAMYYLLLHECCTWPRTVYEYTRCTWPTKWMEYELYLSNVAGVSVLVRFTLLYYFYIHIYYWPCYLIAFIEAYMNYHDGLFFIP